MSKLAHSNQAVADVPEAKPTPGPWHLCHHLRSAENDASCRCGYRGGIWGCDQERIICEMGSQPTPGQEGLEPPRYPRPTELANARLIAAAPDLLSIARRWVALDGGAWHPERFAREKAELDADTRAAIAKAEAS